jgi:hypothetical protein
LILSFYATPSSLCVPFLFSPLSFHIVSYSPVYLIVFFICSELATQLLELMTRCKTQKCRKDLLLNGEGENGGANSALQYYQNNKTTKLAWKCLYCDRMVGSQCLRMGKGIREGKYLLMIVDDGGC